MSPRRRALYAPAFVLVLLTASCGGDAPPDAEEIQSASAVPVAAMDPARFDTVAWATPVAAHDRGATVYAYSCAECHGDSGRGDGGYVLNGRVLRPPTFLAEDWRYANDLPGLREYITAGNDKGMPHWGKAGLSVRDTDAVARYILNRLYAER